VNTVLIPYYYVISQTVFNTRMYFVWLCYDKALIELSLPLLETVGIITTDFDDFDPLNLMLDFVLTLVPFNRSISLVVKGSSVTSGLSVGVVALRKVCCEAESRLTAMAAA
jgi:hypothetical protein